MTLKISAKILPSDLLHNSFDNLTSGVVAQKRVIMLLSMDLFSQKFRYCLTFKENHKLIISKLYSLIIAMP